MFSFFRQTFCQRARSGTRTGAQAPAVRRLECETLEDRTLLSLSGTQLLVNTTKLHPQNQPAVASSPLGRMTSVRMCEINQPTMWRSRMTLERG